LWISERTPGFSAPWLLNQFPDARITSFEPDPLNVEVLTRFIEASVRRDSWRVVEACAGVADGTIALPDGEHRRSRLDASSEAGEASIVPVVDVFPYVGGADLLKMDIEGREWAILEDSRLAETDVTEIYVEYHAHLCPEPEDPR
jgi:FkbM family methyltransferase